MKTLKSWLLKFIWSLKVKDTELTMFQKRILYFIISDGIRDSYKDKQY